MFNVENLCKRVVAIILVFIFVLANCFTILSQVTYAKAEELGKQQTEDYSTNVEYEAYFEKENENLGYECESSIDEEDVEIHAQVKVKNEGYLKNARILIEAENGLNFEINAESTENYQVEGNEILLSNISNDEITDVIIPIRYKEKEDIDNLNKKINVKLIGIYVNNNGNERSISENYVLRLIWNVNTEFNISTELKKYIPYSSNDSKGVIIQTEVKSWIPDENNYVSKEEIKIEAIKIDEYKINKIIIAKKSGENLNESQWNYDDEENIINIKLENDSEKIETEEFLITYILSGEKELELPFIAKSKINGSIFMFGTDEKIEDEVETNYEFENQIGDIVTIEGNSQESVNIGNMLNNKLSEENDYKTNLETSISAEISSTDMVEGIMIKNSEIEFENQEGNYKTSNTYKNISVSKESFDKILGQDGKIDILNESNEVIGSLNSESEIENNQYNAYINGTKIIIKTSKPITEGIIVFNLKSELNNDEYSYEQIKKFTEIDTKYVGSVLYTENAENIVSNIENKIKLEKPRTYSNINISRKELSTIDDNDVEIEIKLNNTTEDIDMYKNPKFEIVFPKYIEDVNISNIAIANSEDVFEIADSTIHKNGEGNIALNIDLKGEQKSYNSNNFSKGTSILVYGKIKLNIYTPSIKEKIKLYYTNENVTTYENEADGKGYSDIEISYKAPIGVVSINKISNYENTGKTVTSVEQGKVTDKIEIFAENKIANMDIVVMNNNETNCNNVKILGRIPFKGNKDVTTGEDLGTTIDTKLYSYITSDEANSSECTIYYSTNGEADENLDDEKNEWKNTTDDLSNIKSYLIVLNNYEMQPGEILKYSYKYEIPGNLEHNTNIYGSFKTIYDNNSNVASVKEESSADIVGLTTGVGPQIAVETNTNVQNKVKEYEKIKYTVKIENTGSEVSEDIVVTTKIPTGATYAVRSNVLTVDAAEGWELKPNREIVTKIEKLNPGDVKKVEFFVQVDKLPSLEEYYSGTEGFEANENGTYLLDGKIIDGLPEIKLVCESIITAKDLAKEIKSEDNGVIVEKANIVAEEIVTTEDNIAKVNETITSKISIKNNSKKTIKNITVTKQLPQGLIFSDSYIRGYEDDGITLKKIYNTDYDASTKTITWHINELEPGRTELAIGEFVIGEMAAGVYKDTISTLTTVNAGGENYSAGQVDIEIGRPYLEVSQLSDKTNEYIKVGENIEYTFTVKNLGAVRAENITLTDKLPKELKIKELSYNADGVEVSKIVTENEDAVVYTSILPEGKLEAKVTAKVNDIASAQKVITNVGTVTSNELGTAKSNDVVNIIENTSNESNLKTTSKQENSIVKSKNNNISKDNNVKKTYEIKGTAWIDENRNGTRDNNEKTFSGIEVRLLNQETGKQVEKNVTNIDGAYEFRNLQNGKYMVVFNYDNSKYSVTEYKKQNVSEDKNSDIITVNNENNVVASTDTITINNGSKSNIDAGFVKATVFDLSLEKRISKVTVQTSNGTNTYNFNNQQLAKVDINGKYLDGAKVIVEYTITVKNEGELEGYAKEVVDYLPKELEFQSELNEGWYKGNDGNLYTEALSNTPIVAGQSKSVTLILTKTMTERNTGIINNEAEISKSYNKAGVAEKDSKNKDKNSADDDMSSADLIIGVKTGETLIYISAIIAGMLIMTIIAVIIRKSRIREKIQVRIGKEV